MSVNQRWAERHARIVDFVTKDDVRAARSRALSAAQKLVHNDDTAASALAANQASQRIIDESSNAEQLSIEVDESLAVLWSAPKQGVDPCQARRDAMPSLAAISSTHLTDSSRDLSPLASLESNSLGTVEVVRCRMDRKIYVLKSMTKGAAKRCYKTTSPMTERRLLAAARDERARAMAPKLVASFQSPASLHIVLEYCPAGDLYNFLESAGQADSTNEARNPSGGLLAERYIRSYARDMVAAIAWLHDCGFMHRDIKPGNWLFDRSGHLLLCDLASAAPFSTFRNIPSSANLAELDAAAAPAEQRRILYRHCTLVGTADYIAPEVFWAAEMLGARASRLNESTRLEDTVEDDAGEGRDDDDDDDDDDEPPPDGPGPHGPECDWWSVGVVIFEMTYKRLPFFAKGVAQTYDMIKNHERHFHLDTWVKCSPDLKDLLCRLITGPQQRLGFSSSGEVQSHPYFANVDWSKPWEGDAAPFIPNVESFSDGSASSHLQEISVLHSPGHKTPYRGLDPDTASSIRSRPDFVAMWAGDSSDFPAFPNSVDLSPRGAASMPPTAHDEVTEDQGDDTTVTVTSSSPSARAHAHVLARAADPKADELSSESTSMLEAQWANFDPLWIGFSYVPDRDAFAAADDELGLSSPARPSPFSSPLGEGFKSPDVAEQWTWQPHAAPTASTPYHKATEPYATILPTPLPMPVSTPYHGTVPRSLHRHAIETASRTKGGTDAAGRPFVTPLRKNSLPNISSASAAFHTPMPPSDPTRRTPASPYPFPLAPSVSRPRATPAVASLKRNDLERARSASASYGATSGEGSDSRCSGGTNAKRDISEREAWKEMEAAVLRSVRKPRQAAVTHAAAPVASRRPPMVHAATDTVLQKQDLVTGSSGGSSSISTSLADRAERKEAGATSQAPGRLMRKASAFGFGGLGGALRAKRPQLPRFLSDRTSKQQQKQPQLAPLDTSLRSPMRKGDRRASAAPIASPASSTASDTTALSSSTIDSSQASPSSSRLRFFPQRSKSSVSSSGTGDAPATSSSSSLAVPGMPKLQKRRSARQLLLKAQERATPTKPTRALSPLMSGPISLNSQGDRSAEASGSSSNHQLPPASGSTSSLPVLGGPLAPQHVGQGRRNSVTDAGSAAPQSSSDDVTSSPTAPRSSKQLPRMPASAPVGQVLALQREETTRTMRRRDSREMLSRYRQGIPTSDDEDEGQKSEDTRKGVNKKQLPTLRHQTSSSTVSVGGVGGVGVGGGGGATITLSSPSLPTFPDAFGGAPAAQDENHIPSSSSVVGLSRRSSGFLNTNAGKPMRRSSMIPLVARPGPEATRAKGPSPLQHPHPQGGVKARSSTDFTFMKDRREETLAAARRPFEKTNSLDAKALAAKRAGIGPLASRFSAANVLPPEPISSATSQQARRWKEKAASSEDVEELGGELGDESGAMEGLGMRHRALQTSLDGVEDRLMRLKLRLRDE